MDATNRMNERHVTGGVDTHKNMHVAGIVDEHDRVLGCQSFATTRHGYKQMLVWMRSFGQIQHVGVECTGTYGAGLLRYLQQAGVDSLEVPTPDRLDRRKRGEDDVGGITGVVGEIIAAHPVLGLQMSNDGLDG